MTVAGEDSVEPRHAPPTSPDLPDRHSPAQHSERPATEVVCPYLMVASGGWRSASPHRDHRCNAVDPAAPLSADKQRRLCLSLAHQACPTFGAARGARAAVVAPGVDPAVLAAAEAARRPVARSAPVLLEQPRLVASPRAGWPLDRALTQAALVGLMLVAFALVVIARLSAADAGSASISPSPASSAAVAASPSPSPTPSPTSSPSPGEVAPSQSVEPSVTATEGPSGRTTYTVQAGDTLVGIASRFGTTAAAIKNLNHLTTTALHTGQKLNIP